MLALFVLATIASIDVHAHPGAGIAVAPDGRVFFVDTGGGIFSIERDGKIVRREGPAYHWFALDPAGRFRRTAWPSIPDATFQASGVNPTLVMSSDFPVTIGTDGVFYVPRRNDAGVVSIIGITPAGARSVKATLPAAQSGGRPAPWVNGLAAGPAGSLYYTEDRAVRRIDARGRVSLVANVNSVPNCESIPGVKRDVLPYLRGLAVAPDGTVYVAASGCGALLKIDPTGKTSVILRTQAPWSPTDVAVANGEIYVLEYSNTASDDRTEWFPRVRKISKTGAVTLIGRTPRR
jgi:hypothetical protein